MSQADSTSNKASDYDFGDLPNEEIDVEVQLMKPEQQNLDVNLMLALNKWVISDDVIGQFGTYGITYSHLSTLSREDLNIMGIRDKKMQDEMLEEFKHLPNQDPTLRNIVGGLREQRRDEEPSSMVQRLQNQIHHLNTLLAAITIQVGASSSSSAGIVVNQRFCSMQIVLDLLGQLSQHTAEMEELILSLTDAKKYDKLEEEYRQKRVQKRKNYIAIISSVGFFIAGLYFAKRLVMKK